VQAAAALIRQRRQLASDWGAAAWVRRGGFLLQSSNLSAGLITHEQRSRTHGDPGLRFSSAPSSGRQSPFLHFHEVIIRRPGTSASKCPHNPHVENISRGARGEEQEDWEREGGESGSNLTWTTFEMEEEVRPTSKKPV